jgi:hypothetical protein
VCRDGACTVHRLSVRATALMQDRLRYLLTLCSVCLVSILRLQSLVAISNSSDPTYDNPPAATWSSVETNVGIICSCLPLLRPLVLRWLPDSLSSCKRSVKSKEKLYAMMSSSKGGKHARSQTEYGLAALPTRKHTRGVSGDLALDIHVVTEVQVQVEKVPQDGWHSSTSAQGVRKQESTEFLV